MSTSAFYILGTGPIPKNLGRRRIFADKPPLPEGRRERPHAPTPDTRMDMLAEDFAAFSVRSQSTLPR